jgi:hypothetical protein
MVSDPERLSVLAKLNENAEGPSGTSPNDTLGRMHKLSADSSGPHCTGTRTSSGLPKRALPAKEPNVAADAKLDEPNAIKASQIRRTSFPLF